jgi:peroxiredoxin
MSKHRVLICGVLSPLLALVLYALVYATLTRFSNDRERDWLFRLSLSTLAMTVPFLATVTLAIRENRRHPFSVSRKVGLTLAALSLGLTWHPVKDGILRFKQFKNMAMRDVAAPPFETVDILGNVQRLSDQAGKVVLINAWATWCLPCRNEMPKLDNLYRTRKGRGLIVFGLSDEDVGAQREYLQEVAVSYPLLTLSGKVPDLYRDIARYPAIFLIDRSGRLQPAPTPDQPFEEVQSAVDALLKRP